jgi:trimeric autotransporter adhesin
MSFGKRTATYAAAAAVLAVAIIGIATLYPGTVAQSSTSSTGGTNQSTSLSPSQNQGQMQTVRTMSTSSAAASSQQTSISQKTSSSSSSSAATSSQQTSSSTQSGLQALLLVQLTDPPVVPTGTTSLNLTYSAIDLITTEQGQNNLVTTNDVTITPQGGSATVDLLRLQNVSQTIATADIPLNSTIYSVSFTVTGISIEVNGNSSTVALATNSTTFQVTLGKPALVGGTTATLLEMSPVIVNTPTGYQMIPSAVAIVKGSSQITHQDETVGSKQQVTQQDHSGLNSAKGQVSATLVGLSSTGTVTTLTVQVNNTGGAPIQLVAIGIHGNFTVQSTASCTSTSSTSSSTTSSSTTSTNSTSTSSSSSSNSTSHGEGSGGQQNGSGQQNGGNGQNGNGHQNGAGNCTGNGHGHGNSQAGNELVFMPVAPASTTTSSSSSSINSTTSSSSSSSTSSSSTTATVGPCTAVNMTLPSGDNGQDGHGGLTLSPGQCVTLTFTGVISFSQSQITVVPNTAPGQTYALHIIASRSAETMMSCVLPLTKTSCTLANAHND